jgi:hypothetical protein
MLPILNRYYFMKNLKIFCLLAPAWLVVGSCRDGVSIFSGQKCKRVCQCSTGWVRFGVADAQGRDYFEQHPDLANYNKFMVYDENWNYAPLNDNGATWEVLKKKNFVNEHYIIYHQMFDPFGIDMKKTFYVKFDQDIDTLRLEYNVKNECMHMNYMRIYLNENEIIPAGGGGKFPDYSFPYDKK